MTRPDLIAVANSPTPSTLYYGSPDIVVRSNDIFMKFVEFGAAGHKNGSGQLDRSIFYKSTDDGLSWSHVSTFDGFYFGVFVKELCVGNDLVLVGNDSGDGNIVLIKSTDNGASWMSYTLLSGASEDYRNQETAYVVDGSTLLIACVTGSGGYPHETICMISADITADLTNPANWTKSAEVTPSLKINEPNVVQLPAGGIQVWARTDIDTPETNLIAKFAWDGSALSFLRYEAFDGGYVKFRIHLDSASGDYFCARNSDPVNDGEDRRTLLVLDRSSDLVYWRRIAILAEAPVTGYEDWGYQYPSLAFDNDDMVFAIRTAIGGIAPNEHDSNQITFARIEDFRTL